jgi:hypothetical protein
MNGLSATSTDGGSVTVEGAVEGVMAGTLKRAAAGSTWVSTLTDGGPIDKPGTAVTYHNTLLGFV